MEIPAEIIDFSLNIKENISSKQAGGKKWRLSLGTVKYFIQNILKTFSTSKANICFLMQTFASVPKH